MALQIIPETGLGERLGTGLGSGLGAGLDLLAQQKLNQLAQRQQDARFSKAFTNIGYSPEEAAFIRTLPPKFQWQAALALAPEAFQQQAPMQAIQENLGALQQEPEAPVMQRLAEQQPMAQQMPPLTMQQVLERLQQQPQQMAAAVQQPVLQQSMQPVAQKEAQQLVPHKQIKELVQEEVKPQKLTPRAKLSALGSAKENKISKEDAADIKKIEKEGTSAENNLKRLDRIEQITKKGNLGFPIFNTAIKTISHGIFGIGLDLTNLMTADAQELDKLSTDFIKDAKDIFGSRMTDADLNAFLKTIPTLYQSNEGRLRIIQNMRTFAEGAALKKKALQQIKRENGGRYPSNWELQIDQRVGPQLDAISKKFGVHEQRPNKSIVGNVLSSLGLQY